MFAQLSCAGEISVPDGIHSSTGRCSKIVRDASLLLSSSLLMSVVGGGKNRLARHMLFEDAVLSVLHPQAQDSWSRHFGGGTPACHTAMHCSAAIVEHSCCRNASVTSTAVEIGCPVALALSQWSRMLPKRNAPVHNTRIHAVLVIRLQEHLGVATHAPHYTPDTTGTCTGSHDQHTRDALEPFVHMCQPQPALIVMHVSLTAP